MKKHYEKCWISIIPNEPICVADDLINIISTSVPDAPNPPEIWTGWV